MRRRMCVTSELMFASDTRPKISAAAAANKGIPLRASEAAGQTRSLRQAYHHKPAACLFPPCGLGFADRLERWPSGLRRQFAKLLYGVNLYRGFESPSLRFRFFFTPRPRGHAR